MRATRAAADFGGGRAEAGAAGERSRTPAPGKRILVVEDDPDTRELLRDALTFSGYAVSTATNGREGLELLEGPDRPCLIVLDLMMPEMNGIEFLERIRGPDGATRVPVLVISAYHDLAASVDGVAGVLEKPLPLDELLRQVERHCGPRH